MEKTKSLSGKNGHGDLAKGLPKPKLPDICKPESIRTVADLKQKITAAKCFAQSLWCFEKALAEAGRIEEGTSRFDLIALADVAIGLERAGFAEYGQAVLAGIPGKDYHYGYAAGEAGKKEGEKIFSPDEKRAIKLARAGSFGKAFEAAGEVGDASRQNGAGTFVEIGKMQARRGHDPAPAFERAALEADKIHFGLEMINGMLWHGGCSRAQAFVNLAQAWAKIGGKLPKKQCLLELLSYAQKESDAKLLKSVAILLPEGDLEFIESKDREDAIAARSELANIFSLKK